MLSDCWQAERGLSFYGAPFFKETTVLYALIENCFELPPLRKKPCRIFFLRLFLPGVLENCFAGDPPSFFGKQTAL